MNARVDLKIFIASSGELEDERKESIAVITGLNKRYQHLHLEPVLYEIDTPSGNFPGKKRIQDGINPLLFDSQIVIVLLYSKAGEFTTEEFHLALSQGKKVYLYLKEGFMPKGVDQTKKYLKVQELIEAVDKENAIRYERYTTVSEYNGLLYKALEKYIDDIYPAPPEVPSSTISTSRQHIPLAPRPYLAHPYSLIKNFTGRREEMTRLTEWYKYEKEPMCIIEAIGGMGKSALCWKWLQDEVITSSPEMDGIVWWSFYDQGFEDFIHHTYEYLIPENARGLHRQIDKTTEVINVLANGRYLIILDGFERVLKGYAQMMAMYIQEEGLSMQEMVEAFDIQQRTPVTPKVEKLLRKLCAGRSKTLMTTRLYPASIESLAGISHIRLSGLSKTDTVAFFKSEGISGTDKEMIHAGSVYGFHPLMLKLLSTAIKRSFIRNIDRALNKGLINEKEPQKILTTSYQLLNPTEQKVASTISVFRTAFTFEAAQALFPDMESVKLEEVMIELCNLGFILYNEQQKLFDFHPILRSYLYTGLTGKDLIHQLAITYFTNLPVVEKIISLVDLEPVIEQYHHLIRAGQYDEAFNIYLQRLIRPLLYQLAQYDLCIVLSQQLFASSSDPMPQLKSRRDQSYILNDLGLCYVYTGQLTKSHKFLIESLIIDYEENDLDYLAASLKNIAGVPNIYSVKFSVAVVHLLKGMAVLNKELDDPFKEKITSIVIAEILIRQARFTSSDSSVIKEYLDGSVTYGVKEFERGVAANASFEYVRLKLEQVDLMDNERHALQRDALNWSLKLMEHADQYRRSFNPNINYFLWAYEAISKSLMALLECDSKWRIKEAYVLFYDEHFQNIKDTIIPLPENYLSLAERCIHTGLFLSRKINRISEECTFSLLLIKIEWGKLKTKQPEAGDLIEIEKMIVDVHLLLSRVEYRILLAELHLLCAEVLLDLQVLRSVRKSEILGLSVTEHIAKVRDYAKDSSTLDDIFLPPDADEFYRDIPQYAMLKRGMTEEERIQNGYYTAWLKADRLEQRIKQIS